MFLIILTYKRPVAEVDVFVAEHRAFLDKHYASGHFLLSGRKLPRDGGVILAKGDSREEIEAIVRLDAFHREQLADYQVIEFQASMTAATLAAFKEV
jgi:uncharacterized protein YciI